MTVTSTVTKQPYTGNGVMTGPFGFSFKVFQKSDIEVYVEGVSMTLGVHYSVTLNTASPGGSVTFVNPPPDAADDENGNPIPNILIRRVMTQTQEVRLPVTGPLPAQTLEAMSDKATMLIQQLQEQIDRSFRVSAALATIVDLTLPNPAPGKGILWNQTGNGLTNSIVDLNLLPDQLTAATAAANASAIAAGASAAQALLAAAAAEGATEAVGGLIYRGDLLTSTGSGNSVIHLGPTNGQVLTVDRTKTNGLSWKAPADGVPVGAVFMWFSNTLPEGDYLWANGQIVSREDNDALYAEWGDTFGAGDGTTTFQVVNMQEVFPLGRSGMGGGTPPGYVTNASTGGSNRGTLGAHVGAETHALTGDQNGPHIHSFIGPSTFTAGRGTGGTNNTAAGSVSSNTDSSGAGTPHNNMPPGIVVNWVIKTGKLPTDDPETPSTAGYALGFLGGVAAT